MFRELRPMKQMKVCTYRPATPEPQPRSRAAAVRIANQLGWTPERVLAAVMNAERLLDHPEDDVLALTEPYEAYLQFWELCDRYGWHSGGGTLHLTLDDVRRYRHRSYDESSCYRTGAPQLVQITAAAYQALRDRERAVELQAARHGLIATPEMFVKPQTGI